MRQSRGVSDVVKRPWNDRSQGDEGDVDRTAVLRRKNLRVLIFIRIKIQAMFLFADDIHDNALEFSECERKLFN